MLQSPSLHEEKFSSTLSATGSKALMRVMKSSGLSAERETLSHLEKPFSLRVTRGGRDFSSPGFLRPTEFPRFPLSVSHITGSLLPLLGFTWKLLVVNIGLFLWRL